MSHYSEDPAMVRVDFFKDTGKWYCNAPGPTCMKYVSNNYREIIIV